MSESTADQPIPRPTNSHRVVDNVKDELEFHLAAATEEAKANGLSDHDALSLAQTQFGNFEKIRLTCLKLAWKERLMEKLFSPAVTIVLFLLTLGVAVVMFFQAHANQAMANEARNQMMQAQASANMALEQAKKSEDRAKQATQMLIEAFRDANTENQQADFDNEAFKQLLSATATTIQQQYKDDPVTLEKLKSAIDEAMKKLEDDNDQ